MTASGAATVDYAVMPPAPFSEAGERTPSPIFNAGGLRILLDEIPSLLGQARGWRDSVLASAGEATDPGETAHYRYHAATWDRGLPIARNAGGDIVAVDLQDPGERLMRLFHDGADAPASLLGQDLREHLAQQARLAFPGFETYRLALFTDAAKNQAAEAAFAASVDMDAIRRHGLLLPRGAVLDADGANGLAWRQWLRL